MIILIIIRNAELFGNFFCAFLINIRNGTKLCLRDMIGYGFCMNLAYPARADDTDFDLLHKQYPFFVNLREKRGPQPVILNRKQIRSFQLFKLF